MTSYLSHSQCELWGKCPKAYFLTKIEGAPQAPSESLILGSAVHEAFEADGREIMEHGAGRNLAEMWRVFKSALEARIESDDPTRLIGDETYDDIAGKGEAII